MSKHRTASPLAFHLLGVKASLLQCIRSQAPPSFRQSCNRRLHQQRGRFAPLHRTTVDANGFRCMNAAVDMTQNRVPTGLDNPQALRSSSYRLSSHMAGQAMERDAPEQIDEGASSPTLFRSLQAYHLKPLKRKAKYGIPCCDLQLRSYSVRNLEFFADFALRAAYYLNLPALGPVPLPRITERWTVPKSNFIFKKSQENFERITTRRMIQIQDGHIEAIEIWLALLRRRQYHGVGMKANVWCAASFDLGARDERGDEMLRQIRLESESLQEILENEVASKDVLDRMLQRLDT